MLVVQARIYPGPVLELSKRRPSPVPAAKTKQACPGFTVLARRTILAPALACALAAAVAACTGSRSFAPASAAPASAAPASAAPAATAPAAANTVAAAALIAANWEKVFNGSTPAWQKISLVQNGRTLTTAIGDSRKWPSELGSYVLAVRLDSAASAAVTYTIAVSGFSEPALSGLTGTAVYQNGVWKVGDVSLCAVLKLVPGGPVPSGCSSAG
jgi:hypothetical protein